MKTRSAKQKGKRLQLKIRDIFRQIFNGKLEDGDIESTIASESGIDIKLSPSAKKLIPMDIECKNQEKINIWASLKQSEDNCKDKSRIPMVIFSRNRSKTYCVMEFDKFIKLVYDVDINIVKETEDLEYLQTQLNVIENINKEK